MSWNHRVVKRTYESGETTYAIHEAHYRKDSDVATSITVNAVAPVGENPDELRRELSLFVRALSKPVLNYEDF